MDQALKYKNEGTLGVIALIVGILCWIAIVVGTFGIVLIYVLFFYLAYLFAQSAFISHIKGTAIRLSGTQLPELHQRFLECCEKLGIDDIPDVYLLNGNGMFNAFATRFLGRNFVVLYSDIVDAMDQLPEGIKFYIGHELGHIRLRHLIDRIWRAPAMVLPLLGPAYSRAKEYSCDLHGRACCTTDEVASRALVALAAGRKRWIDVNIAEYVGTASHVPGFWMSYHELCASYPWLNKRLANIQDTNVDVANRNSFAYVLAFFTPNIGNIGGGVGPLFMIAIIGILAAVALPAYKDYTIRAKLSGDIMASQLVTAVLADYYSSHHQVPSSLDGVDLPSTLSTGASLELDSRTMTLHVRRKEGGFVLVPRTDGQHKIVWMCKPDETTKATALPMSCR